MLMSFKSICFPLVDVHKLNDTSEGLNVNDVISCVELIANDKAHKKDLYLSVNGLSDAEIHRHIGAASSLSQLNILQEKYDKNGRQIEITRSNWTGNSSSLAIWLAYHFNLTLFNKNADKLLLVTADGNVENGEIKLKPLLKNDFEHSSWLSLAAKVYYSYAQSSVALLLKSDKENLLAHTDRSLPNGEYYIEHLSRLFGLVGDKKIEFLTWLTNEKSIIAIDDNFLAKDKLEGTLTDLSIKLSIPLFDEKEVTTRFDSFYKYVIPEGVEGISIARGGFLEGYGRRKLNIEEGSLWQKILHPSNLSLFSGDFDSRRKHIILSGPTSSGKTEIACGLLLNRVIQSKTDGNIHPLRGLYIGPIKSLAEELKEKLSEFKGILTSLCLSDTEINEQLNHTDSFSPILLSTGDEKLDDWKFKTPKNELNYLIGVTVNEKANLFAAVENDEFIKGLCCVVIDEIHMINSDGRARLESFISKLRREAERRLNVNETPLTIIVITTEPSDFTESFERRGYEPWNFHTNKRPVEASHNLIIYKGDVVLEEETVNKEKQPFFHYFEISNTIDSFRKISLSELYTKLEDEVKKETLSEKGEKVKVRKNANSQAHNNALHAIIDVISKDSPSSMMIICNSIQGSFTLANELRENNSLPIIKAEIYQRFFDYGESSFVDVVDKSDLPEERKKVLKILSQKGIFLHNSASERNVRNNIQHLLSSKERDIPRIYVIATETLAYGVNLNTDTVFFYNCKFYRNSGDQQLYLNAHEYHNMAGRAGRSGFGHDIAKIYLYCEKKYLLSNKQKFKKDAPMVNFLSAMFCDQEEVFSESLNGESINAVRSLMKLSSKFLTLTRQQFHEHFDVNRQDYGKIQNTGLGEPCFDYNLTLHTLLDAIWYGGLNEGEAISLSTMTQRFLSYSLYFSNDLELFESPFLPQLDGDGLNFSKVNFGKRGQLGKLLDFFEWFLSLSRFEAMQLFEKSERHGTSYYSVTKAGQSLVSTGTHYETGQSFEYWIRLMTNIREEKYNHLNQISAECFIPALVFSKEIFVKFSKDSPELKAFYGKAVSGNLDSFVSTLFNNQKKALFDNYGNEYGEYVFDCISSAFDQVELEGATEAEIDYIFRLNDDGFLKPFSDKASSGDSDDVIDNNRVNDTIKKLKTCILLRLVNLVYRWMNGASWEEVEEHLKFTNSEISSLNSIENDEARRFKRDLNNEGGIWNPNAGLHLQLVYKSKNLLSFFEGREGNNAYEILKYINFNGDVFERRLRNGCIHKLTPIATALGNTYNRRVFAESNIDGFYELYKVLAGEQQLLIIQSVPEYPIKLKKYFAKIYKAFKASLCRYLNFNEEYGGSLSTTWVALSDYVNVLTKIIPDNQDVNQAHENLNESVAVLLNAYNLSIKVDMFGVFVGDETNEKTISIFSLLVLLVLHNRELCRIDMDINYVLNNIREGECFLYIVDILNLSDIKHDAQHFIEIKRACLAFDEPMNSL
jgi:hypothetical protein